MALPVPAPLVPYVRSVQPYDVTYDVSSGVHVGMPGPHLTLVLALDEPLDVAWAGVPGSRTQSWGSVSGLHLRPAEVHHAGRQRGIQLALTVAGARALLGTPAAALEGRLLDVGDVAAPVRSLPEQLDAAPTWPARLAVLEEALRETLARQALGPARSELGRALALLARGQRVATVADDVGYSRRRLTTLVRQEVGISPKAYQRLARFDRSHRLVRVNAASGDLRLAAVAADAGYADQAHLAREWSQLAGCSPSAWVAREFPIVQASARLDPAA